MTHTERGVQRKLRIFDMPSKLATFARLVGIPASLAGASIAGKQPCNGREKRAW
jgi:hypothetical protein